jgi:hypothetical protein
MIQIHTLIECDATGRISIDKDFVHHHLIKEKTQKESRELEVIDRRHIQSETIITMVKLDPGIYAHQEQLPVFITKLEYYPTGLGLLWLQLHNISIKYQNKRIEFESKYCRQYCQHHTNVLVSGNCMETVKKLETPKVDI